MKVKDYLQIWLEKIKIKQFSIKNSEKNLNNELFSFFNILNKLASSNPSTLNLTEYQITFSIKNTDNIFKILSVNETSELTIIFKKFNESFISLNKNKFKKFQSPIYFYNIFEFAANNPLFFIGIFLNELALLVKENNFFLNSLISHLWVSLQQNINLRLSSTLEKTINLDRADCITLSDMLITTAIDLNIIHVDNYESDIFELDFNYKHFKKNPKMFSIKNQFIKNHIWLIYSILNIKLPMLVKPINWVKDNSNTYCYYLGGYLLSEQYKNLSLDLTSKLSSDHSLLDLSQNFIHAINYLQNEAFQINKEYLSYIFDQDISFLENNFKYYDLKSRKDLNINLNNYLNNINCSISEETICYEILFQLFIYDCLKNYNLYFVYFIDFRSRIYPYGYPLTFYTNKIFRGLFINSVNRGIIPFRIDNLDFYLKELDKFSLLSYNLLYQKNLFLIGMDACASAFQIQGCIVFDLNIMKLTNIYNEEKFHNDIYRYIMVNFKDHILNNNLIDFPFYNNLYSKPKKNYILSFSKSFDFKKIFEDICEDREFFKTIILPLSYNEGSQSRIKKFNLYFLKLLNLNVIKFATNLDNEFIKFIDKTFPKLQILKKLLKKIASIKSEGILLNNDYIKLLQFYPEVNAVNIFRRGKYGVPRQYKFTLKNYDKIDKNKQKIATLVNFIHSLDAAILINVLLRCLKENINVFTIHDSFYVNLHNISLIIKIYNEAYIEELIIKEPLKRLLLSNKINLEDPSIKKLLISLDFYKKWSADDIKIIKNSINSLKV